MNRNTRIEVIILLLCLVISITSSTARSSTQELEWKVKEGDTQAYTVKKCFDDFDIDDDGDKNNLKVNITDEDGKSVEITLKKGTTLKAEIVSLDSSNETQFFFPSNYSISGQAAVKLTFNNEVTGNFPDFFFFPFVIKTVDNKSYWEDQAEANNFSVVGDLIVLVVEGDIFGDPLEMTLKWNWKTGWLTFYSVTMIFSSWFSNRTDEFEFEFSTGIYTDTTPTSIVTGWNVIFLLLGIIIIIPLRQRKRTPSNK
ncbi:MAG: hypothetical protein ACFE8U_16250 [Candidatus Hermodarchaeota archaeon]